MFHLTTHAFFKALLFLGAGSVIIALHHEQDIWKMGGLWKKTPITFATFLIGTLALAGVWPLAGFYSKDEILLLAFHKSLPLFFIGTVTAGLTAYYMGRELFVVFFGKPRDRHTYEHAHESPLRDDRCHWFSSRFSRSLPAGRARCRIFSIPAARWSTATSVTPCCCVPIAGFLVAAKIYWKPEPSDAPVKSSLGEIWTTAREQVLLRRVVSLAGEIRAGHDCGDL